MTEEEKQREIDELKKMGDLPGLEDIMVVYDSVQEILKISYEYLKEMDPKVVFSTTDSTS